MTGRAETDRFLRWYPRLWRARYGDELAALVEDQLDGRHAGFFLRMSLVAHGIAERGRSIIFPGRLADGDPVRDGSLVVLGAFTVFCCAGGSFAKLTEHFASSMPPGTQVLPNDALTTVQVLAPFAGLAVVLGVLLAFPACVSYVRNGGWSRVRRYALAALGASVVAIAGTCAVALWGRHLTNAQRNGADGAYSAAFLAAVGALCVAPALWATPRGARCPSGPPPSIRGANSRGIGGDGGVRDGRHDGHDRCLVGGGSRDRATPR